MQNGFGARSEEMGGKCAAVLWVTLCPLFSSARLYNVSTWIDGYISWVSLSCVLAWAPREIPVGDVEGEVKQQPFCSSAMLSPACWLSLTCERQWPLLKILYLPLGPSSASLTPEPGMGVYLYDKDPHTTKVRGSKN